MVFNSSVVLFDFDTSVKFKDKISFKNTVLENGGCVSYSLNNKVKLLSQVNFQFFYSIA